MSETSPSARVSRITMARLFNIGNYEHARYEVTVEIPEGTHPGVVAAELAAALEDLRPFCRWDHYSVARAAKTLKLPKTEVTAADREDAQKVLADWEGWKAARAAAFERLASIGADVSSTFQAGMSDTDGGTGA